jgi:polyisoprenoid-binding protein YceI
MKKITLVPLLFAVIFLLSGCFALAEPEESSGTVVAPTLAAPENQEQAVEEATAAPQPTPTEEAMEPYPAQDAAAPEPPPASSDTADAYPAGEEAPAPDQAEPPADYPAPAEGEGAVQNTAVYEIDPARSEARFTINEVLRGAPKTVIGVSQNLGGQIMLDLNNPAAAQIGAILINARDFATDNEFRNNAIANEILLTNQYEFITFEPTAISGLPETAEIGQTYPLQITGNLTITDQTREVTFDAQVTPLSETELQGLASLDILYADYGLTIPFARSVESVEDNVLLEIEFIAAQ